MEAKELARKIAKRVKEEYSVVIFSLSFCDEPGDVDFVSEEDLTKIIEEVINKNS